MSGILLSVGVLGSAALVALFLTVSRGAGRRDEPRVRGVTWLALVAIVVQSGHFTEERLTGFDHRFPGLFGLEPMPESFFVGFNLAWIAIWLLSVAGLRAGLHAALFPLWFLAVGCTLNGVFHPTFAVVEGGYFPGLWSSPLSGLVGVALLTCLTRFTARDAGDAAHSVDA